MEKQKETIHLAGFLFQPKEWTACGHKVEPELKVSKLINKVNCIICFRRFIYRLLRQ